MSWKQVKDWAQTAFVVISVAASAWVTIGVTKSQVSDLRRDMVELRRETSENTDRIIVLETIRENDAKLHAKIDANSTAIGAMHVTLQLLKMGLEHLRSDIESLKRRYGQ